jgi:futalosine hydrolase
MRVLIVAATESEVQSLKSEVRPKTQDLRLKTLDLEFLITGVGMVATAFALGKHLATNKYDLAINLGIAGAFDRSIELGEVLEITEDTFAELGAEDGDEFITIDKLGFGTGTFKPTTTLSSLHKSIVLKTATAITVNTINGNKVFIQKITKRLGPQTESMEGAAFFYACNQMNVPCIQIRAVSNYVEKRNRDNWKIGPAIKNLNTFVIEFLKQL